MRRALVILGVLIATILGTLFVAPIMIDWDKYRGAIEEEASRIAGREVRIGGRINVRLLPVPYIHIERLRVADTTAAIGEPLFKAEALTMWLALSPLVGGSIEARRVELTGPVVNLVLDDNGSGNWASLPRVGGAPTLPGRIALEDVRVSDGSLVVRAPGGSVRAQFLQISGTISAAALEGPYRVSLSFAENDAGSDAAAARTEKNWRELRLSTARQDPDGSVRFKGTVRTPSRNHSWAVDGAVHDLLGRVRVDGNLTARVPFIKTDPVAARSRSAPPPAMVEIKSTLKADTASAELADLTLTVDAEGRPQLATGAAKFTWRQRTTAEILVKARWIDVDRIIGTEASTASTATLARIVAGFGDALPDTDHLRALVLLDQATLNGDVISGLKVDVEKGVDGYDIRELSGNLPGSARLVLSGRLTPGAAEADFDGPVTLRGASFNRFVAWAGRGQQPPEIAQDGPFALDARITAGPTRIAGRDIRLELPGGRLGGDASWTWGPAGKGTATTGSNGGNDAGPAIVLALDGPSLDIGALLPSEPRPGALLRSLVASLTLPPADRRDSVKKATSQVPSADIRLRFGRLATRSAIYHDVDAELRWDGRSWRVPGLRASGASGWRIELEGDLAGVDDANPTGTIAGVVSTPNRTALNDFLAWLEIPTTGILEPDRLARISPLRLAGRLQLNPQAGTKTGIEPGSAKLTVDGTVGESRITALITAPRRAETLAKQPLEIDLTADVPAITTLLGQIAPEGWTAPSSARIAMPARLTLTAVGQIGDGMQTLATLSSAGLRSELRGNLRAPPGGATELAGTLQIAADDLAHLFATTALGRSERLAGLPVAGRVAVNLSGKRLKLETEDLALAETRLRGAFDLDFSKPVKRLDARISSSRVDLSRILVPILDERALAAAPAQPRVEAPSWWPESPFDLDRLDGFEGSIVLDTSEFVVANDVALRPARIETAIKQGALDIRLVDAGAQGGKATGRFLLAKAPAGAALKGNLRIDGAELATAPPGSRPPPLAGRVQLTLDVAGVALTARGLVAALAGTGEVRLTDGILNHVSPAAIAEASDAVLGPEGSLAPGHLEKMVRARLGAEPISLGRRRIALTVSDGHIRTAPVVAETKSGRVSGTTILDLDTQRVDSEWKLDGTALAPRKGAKARGPLPTVTVIWAGPLARLASIEPQVHVDALERELSVRRMEGEVDELERVRRLDEDRARQEAERQRALEVERQREAERARTPQPQTAPWPPAVPIPAPAAPGSGALAPSSSPPPATKEAESAIPAPAPGDPAALPKPPAPRPVARPAAKRPFNPFSTME